ncbi:hypothetical protein LQ318_06620 [Aliifodinibius salicampi]|uniref:Iron-sulfur cluster repair protein YtfE, RIC family, contains ScdAN and hemerythrin domains n=1 Tax=Fodinibius salicampi TaxID=1920655 RepID=A0ABT3PXJ2_9BACT|nr:hypothetical protein [Fodinibius salicampi]MCW9712571.1 hypothetical protein [Fodinibius salicampi]
MNSDQSFKQVTPDAKLNQIISVYDKAAQLLASIGLDPSNHKEETLRSVCQQRHWSEVEVLDWVKKHHEDYSIQEDQHKQTDIDYDDSLPQWITYLEEEFLKRSISLLDEISDSFSRVHKIHGNQYPWLKNMEWHFNSFDEALRLYYGFERNKFYPIALRLYNNDNGNVLDGTIRKLERSLKIIEDDQERLIKLKDVVKERGNNFKNPEGACTTLCIMNHNFFELEEILEKQFRIEVENVIPIVRQELNVI